jgi:hypothetical protein
VAGVKRSHFLEHLSAEDIALDRQAPALAGSQQNAAKSRAFWFMVQCE